jgi:hypothetical protein
MPFADFHPSTVPFNIFYFPIFGGMIPQGKFGSLQHHEATKRFIFIYFSTGKGYTAMLKYLSDTFTKTMAILGFHYGIMQ